MPKSVEIFKVALGETVFNSSNLGRKCWDATYTIYPIFALDALIHKMSARARPIDTIRYLVDTNKHLWFAEEGFANATIPAHYQMTGSPASSARCIAAGNIVFSADYKSIVTINHKSGDFRPNFDSITWPLAILIAHEDALKSLSIQMKSTLVIEKLTSSGGVKARYPLEKDELTAWLMSALSKETMDILRDQPHAVRTVSYEAPAALSVLRPCYFFPDVTSPRPSSSEDQTEVEEKFVPRTLTFSDL